MADARRVVVDDHVVVVQVRDRAAAVAVQAERERADHERLEVVHEVAADEPRRVRRSPSAAAGAASRTRRPRATTYARRAPRARRRRRRGSARRVARAAGARRAATSVDVATRAGSRSDRSAARRRSGATGSPLASIGQPKNPQNPQLLHAGRPSYGTRVHAGRRAVRVVARAASRPRSVSDRAEHVGARAASGTGPTRHSANGFAPASPATPTSRSASA